MYYINILKLDGWQDTLKEIHHLKADTYSDAYNEAKEYVKKLLKKDYKVSEVTLYEGLYIDDININVIIKEEQKIKEKEEVEYNEYLRLKEKYEKDLTK